MKKLLLFCAAICTGLLGVAQLNQVVVEPYTLQGATSVQPAGTTTYRIYAEMANPADLVTAVFAIDGCHPLDVSTTTNFFNDAVGGTNPAGINPAFYAFFPNLEADSWITIGVQDSTSPGAADINQAATNPANPFAPAVNTVPGSNLVMDDGAWFTLPTSASALPSGPNNRVLLGQFTTDGELSFNINVQAFLNGDQAGGRVDYVWSAPCAAGGSQTGFEEENISLTYPSGVPGCTDAAACNYDPAATIDDGSCILPPANDLCANATDLGSASVTLVGETNVNACNNEGTVVPDGGCNTTSTWCDGDGVSAFEENSIWYTFTTPALPAEVTINCTNGFDTQIAILDGCGGSVLYANDDANPGFQAGLNFACGELAVSTQYWVLIDGYLGDTGTFDLVFTVDDVICATGCTDPNAINFNPGATIDDGSCVVPTCAPTTPDNYTYCYGDGETTEFIYTAANVGDEVIVAVNAGSFETCCDDFIIYDGVGTGGAILYSGTGDVSGVIVESTTGALTILIDSDGSVSCGGFGTFDTLDYDVYCGVAAVPGCTDPLATNYDPAATIDDGSCVFCTDNLVEIDVIPGDFPGEMSFDVFDGGGALVYSGTGNDGLVTLCLVTDCYQIDMFDSFGDGWNLGALDIYVGGSFQESIDLDSAPVGDNPGANDDFGTNWVDIGGSGTCPVLGCTDMTACNYDPAATLDDGSCVPAPCINDLPSLAYALTMNPLGTCDGFVGEDVAAATIAAPEGIAFTSGSGNDLWYSFVATTSGARVEVITGDFDALIELQDASNNLVDIEDVVFVDGGEVLNFGSLTAGDTYYVRVAPYFDVVGPALFDICVQEIPDTRCDYGPGPYDLCNLFKADWVGADDYIFNFTSQTDFTTYTYQSGGPNTFVALFNVSGLPWGDSYEVAINAVFDLTDGNGNVESIEVQNDEPCAMDVNPQPLSKLRDADNEANYGPHLITDYVQTTPWVCGTIDWEWEFVNTDGSQLPINHLRGATNRWQRLSDVAGLQLGAVYEVRVRPIFVNGPGAYGAMELLSIIGPAGIVGEVVSPVVLDDQAERLDVVEAGDLTIYPNPNAGDAMTVSINGIASDVERVNVDIYDMAGKLVVSEQIASNGTANLQVQMSLVELTSGVYNVRITAGAIVMNERLVISK